MARSALNHYKLYFQRSIGNLSKRFRCQQRKEKAAPVKEDGCKGTGGK